MRFQRKLKIARNKFTVLLHSPCICPCMDMYCKCNFGKHGNYIWSNGTWQTLKRLVFSSCCSCFKFGDFNITPKRRQKFSVFCRIYRFVEIQLLCYQYIDNLPWIMCTSVCSIYNPIRWKSFRKCLLLLRR